MDKAKLQRMLNKLAKDSVALEAAAREVFGPEAHVFAEAEGGLSIMVGDDTAETDNHRVTLTSRQKHIVMSAKTYHRLGVGAW
jgi:hypothetical protein